MLTLAPKNTKTQGQAAKGQGDEAWLVSSCSQGYWGAGNCGDHLRLDHFIAVILMFEVTVSGRVRIQTRVFGFFWDSRNTHLLDFSGAEFRITEGEWTRKKQYKISGEIKTCRGS